MPIGQWSIEATVCWSEREPSTTAVDRRSTPSARADRCRCPGPPGDRAPDHLIADRPELLADLLPTSGRPARPTNRHLTKVPTSLGSKNEARVDVRSSCGGRPERRLLVAERPVQKRRWRRARRPVSTSNGDAGAHGKTPAPTTPAVHVSPVPPPPHPRAHDR